MKKLVMLGIAVLLTACPVACVNDPTDSEETCVETSTDTDVVCEVSSDTSTETAVE